MKQPNWKAPLALSAALLGVGTFTYWLKYNHTPKKEKAETQTKKPLALPGEDTQISMIKLKSSRGLIEIKCGSWAEKKCTISSLGKWVITNPTPPTGAPYEADPSEVKSFLTGVTNAVATEVIDLRDETAEKRKSLLSEYGLSDEKRTSVDTQFIELILADDKGGPGKRLTAWFGQEHPLGDKTFVASSIDGTLNDQTVFLISNQFRNSNFTKSVTSFREKALFTFDRKDITEYTAKVVVEKKNGGKVFAQRVNNLWTVNGNPANADHIETVISALANAKATDFADASLIKGLKPIITYSLRGNAKDYAFSLFEKNLPARTIVKGKDEQKLAAEKRYYAQSSEQKELAEVESMLRSNIDKGMADLRNNVLFSETEKVTATNFKAEAPTYSSTPEFSYIKGNWLAKDGSKNWDAVNASKIVNLLAMTRIKDFLSPAPNGKELVTLSIGDDKNPTKFHVKFYTVKDKLYARDLNAKTNEAYLMEDSMTPALPKTENEWKIIAPKK